MLPFALGRLVGALELCLAWLVGEYLLNSLLFRPVHAGAVLQAVLLWRGIVGVAGVCGDGGAFNAVLQGPRGERAAGGGGPGRTRTGRTELMAISGKLNPHFLFNTLNS